MNDQPNPAIGRPFRGGIIVSTTGRKWGLVQMPDGRRLVHDVSEVITTAAEQPAAPTTSGRRLDGLSTYADLADEAGIEASTQLLLERLMEAHNQAHRRHTEAVPEEHDGLA